jgi:hypothetical protein
VLVRLLSKVWQGYGSGVSNRRPDGLHILPPPRRCNPDPDLGIPVVREDAPLPPLEDFTGKTTVHEHVCGVGTSHRPGAPEYRRCRCGQWYMWTSSSWVQVRNPGIRWAHEHRADDFFDLADGSWAEAGQSLSLIDHLVIRWRMLRMLLRELTGH